MAESLMLKDEAGRIVGYVLLQGGRLLMRIAGSGEAAQICVLGADGERVQTQICCNGTETEAAFAGSGFDGAYAASGGRLIAAAGEGKQAFAQEKNGKNENKRMTERKKTPDSNVCIEKAFGKTCTAIDMQRRWPPPPCWPSACYVGGCWTEKEGE